MEIIHKMDHQTRGMAPADELPPVKEARRDEEDRQMKEAQEKMRSGAAVQGWKMRRVGASLYIYNMYIYI